MLEKAAVNIYVAWLGQTFDELIKLSSIDKMLLKVVKKVFI